MDHSYIKYFLKSHFPLEPLHYLGFKNYYASPGKLLLYGIATIALPSLPILVRQK
jgi:hypothetical protein